MKIDDRERKVYEAVEAAFEGCADRPDVGKAIALLQAMRARDMAKWRLEHAERRMDQDQG